MQTRDARVNKLFALCLELDYVDVATLVEQLQSRLREIAQTFKRAKAREVQQEKQAGKEFAWQARQATQQETDDPRAVSPSAKRRAGRPKGRSGGSSG